MGYVIKMFKVNENNIEVYYRTRFSSYNFTMHSHQAHVFDSYEDASLAFKFVLKRIKHFNTRYGDKYDPYILYRIEL